MIRLLCRLLPWLLLAVPAAAEEAVTLRVGGTGASLGLLRALGEEFSRRQPDVRVVVEPNLGSRGAIAAVAAKALDLGVSSRALGPEDLAKGLRQREFARTAFVVAVHRDVPVQGLTLSQLAAIYSGATASWPDGTPVRIVLRPERDFDTGALRAMSPELDRAVLAAQARPGLPVAVTDQESAQRLERVPGSIGTSSLAVLTGERRSLRALAIEGVAPTLQALDSGAYRFSRPLYLVSAAAPPAAAQAFEAFLATSAAGEVLLRNGAVPWQPAR